MKKNIIVIGAGYGGITAVLKLHQLLKKQQDYQIHLIDRNPYHTLKTQLHEAAIKRAEVAIPIEQLIRGKDIIFHLAEVKAIDIEKKNIKINELKLPFTYLLLALGSQANYYNIEGLQRYSLALQSLKDAEMIYSHIRRLMTEASCKDNELDKRDLLRFVIGGGGLSGVEFAAELSDYITENCTAFGLSTELFEVIIVEGASRVVSTADEEISMQITQKLASKGIKILTNTRVVNQTDSMVSLSNGTTLNTKTVIWTGGIKISEILQQAGFKTGSLGRIIVNEYLQAEGQQQIFAIGDNALCINKDTGNPVPASAQFALQQGKVAAQNIFNHIHQLPLQIFIPKVRGEVISLGMHLAIGWLALPFAKKITFIGFLANLLKYAVKEKHLLQLKNASRDWLK